MDENLKKRNRAAFNAMMNLWFIAYFWAVMVNDSTNFLLGVLLFLAIMGELRKWIEVL